MKTQTQTPAVAEAFADLDHARTTLASAEAEMRRHRNTLRRYARKHGFARLRAAREDYRLNHLPEYLALINAELAHEKAHRQFRRVAMIAALTRVCETDKLIKRAQELEPPRYLTYGEFLRLPECFAERAASYPDRFLRRTFTRLALPAPAEPQAHRAEAAA
jgi:hypothetical protein